jgi:hypothetical protein
VDGAPRRRDGLDRRGHARGARDVDRLEHRFTARSLHLFGHRRGVGIGDVPGGDAALLPLWWALSLGACLGGNGTLIGASANLVVAGLAERGGVPFRFVPFLKIAFPLMLLSIVLSHAYLWWRFL